MYTKVYSAILDGLEGKIIEVEAGLLPGLNSFSIVGLGDKAVQEAKERINLALKSINAKPPLKFNRKTVINLAPADIKKEGSSLDLAIAISFLIASKQLSPIQKSILILGELSLDGKLRKIKGALPIVLSLHKYFEEIYLPQENYPEVKYLKIDNLYIFESLKEIIEHLEGKATKDKFKGENFVQGEKDLELEFIKISDYILRAITIACIGRHNLILYGPPGTGKTLISKNIVNLLSELTYEEALEVTTIYSSANELKDGFITYPPFRNPHHSSSSVAILGGGQNPKPGEVSLAHRGVLFLDELPEFKRDVLEGLREPLENGEITISRSRKTIKMPARFMLIGAYNPCPCGFYLDLEKECKCTLNEIKKYHKKLSGPIMDRIDIKINVPRIKGEEIFTETVANYKDVIEKIKELKDLQFKRQNKFNSELNVKEIKEYCKLSFKAEDFLKKSADKLRLSIRGVHKIIKIARTIADFENKNIIDLEHIAEALQYRNTKEDEL